MAHRLLISFLSVLLAAPAFGWDVTVAWDPNPPEERVVGYVVSYGRVSRHDPAFSGYDQEMDVPGTAVSLEFGDDTGGVYLAVSAYNESGLRSDYSVELRADREGGLGETPTDDSGGGTEDAAGSSPTRSSGGGGGCFLQTLLPR